MKKRTIHTEKEVLGLVFLAEELKKTYRKDFALSNRNGCLKLEALTEEKKLKVSLSSFERVFSFIEKPTPILRGTINKIVQWYSNNELKTFKDYIIKNEALIYKSQILTEETLQIILKKLNTNKNQKTEPKENFERHSETDSVTKVNNRVTLEPSNPVSLILKLDWWLSGIIIIALLLFAWFVFFKTEKEQEAITLPSTETNISIETANFVVSDANRVIPNQNTAFFDSNQQPQLWFTTYQNETEYYNTAGKHPNTNRMLQPVTKEVVETFKKEHNIDIKVDENLEKSIVSSTVAKTEVLIKNNTLFDAAISNHIRNNYKSTDAVFLCKGNVNYTFKQSKRSENRTVCNLELTFTVQSVKTKAQIDNRFITTIGTGFSEEQAKLNAISKIQF